MINLFYPFFRRIVRAIKMNIIGDSIRETDEPGKGARFEITVPKEAYRIADQSMNK